MKKPIHRNRNNLNRYCKMLNHQYRGRPLKHWEEHEIWHDVLKYGGVAFAGDGRLPTGEWEKKAIASYAKYVYLILEYNRDKFMFSCKQVHARDLSSAAIEALEHLKIRNISCKAIEKVERDEQL